MGHSGEEIKKLMEAKGLNAYDVAAHLGISVPGVYNLLKRENIKEIQFDSVYKVIEQIGKAVIASEPKAMYNAQPVSMIGTPNMFIVPVKAFGGFLSGYGSRVYLDALEKTSFPFVKGDCFAFEVDGYSMLPDYPPHSYVVGTPIENLDWLQKGKDYVFQTIDGIIIKTFVKKDTTMCTLKSKNEDYNPVPPIPLKNIKKVYHIEQKITKPD